MAKTGRPSSYKPVFAKQAEKLCELGATDEEMAEFFEVNVRTIYRWQGEFPQFCQALKAGKAAADDRVERSLYHKAVGYKHEAVKIFMPAGAPAPVYAPYVEHVPPDTTAAIFWLKNRRSGAWRDKHEVIQSGTITHTHSFNEEALAALSREDLEAFSVVAGRLLAAPAALPKPDKAN